MNKVWIGTEESLLAHAARYAAIQERVGPIELLRHVVNKPAKAETKLSEDDDDDEDYRYPNPVGYQLIGNVAVLSISGGTEDKTSWITRFLSIATYQDIQERLIQAYEDTAVKSVLLLLDTPGGYASGAFTLAEFVASYSSKLKPIVSYTENSVASAGVLYGTAASALFANKFAMVGSVGAVIMFMDFSEYLKQMKITPTVFRSAPYKAVPNALEGLDEKGKEVLQENVNLWHNRFVDQLETNLGISAKDINKNIASGRMFTADKAVSLGLVKSITPMDKLLATMNSKYQNIN